MEAPSSHCQDPQPEKNPIFWLFLHRSAWELVIHVALHIDPHLSYPLPAVASYSVRYASSKKAGLDSIR
jgi:hypothetical protein